MMRSRTGANPQRYLLTPPVQLFRLSGGIRLISDVKGKCHVIGIKAGRDVHINLNRAQIGSSFFDYSNIRILARSKCYDDSELNDPISDILALRAIGSDGKCLAYSQQFYWSGVSHVLHERGMFSEEGLVRRLITQIRTSLRRFEKLFSAYSAFLKTLADSPPKARHFVANKHAANIGIEFTAFLDALYGFRDAVNSTGLPPEKWSSLK